VSAPATKEAPRADPFHIVWPQIFWRNLRFKDLKESLKPNANLKKARSAVALIQGGTHDKGPKACRGIERNCQAAAPSVAGHGCLVGVELTGPVPGSRRPLARFWRLNAGGRGPSGPAGALVARRAFRVRPWVWRMCGLRRSAGACFRRGGLLAHGRLRSGSAAGEDARCYCDQSPH
jgi:hypothetical protein